MPPRKKALLVSFEEAPEQAPEQQSPIPQESMVSPTVEKAVRTRRKPAKSTDTKEAEVEAKAVTGTEAKKLTEVQTDAAANDNVHNEETTAPQQAETLSDSADAAGLNQQEFVFEGKINKKLRNETHTKEQFFIRNDLLERLEALVLTQSKGFKTVFINYALGKALDELEKANETKA
jgi:hypothetical protein